jgi:hypothetical protein
MQTTTEPSAAVRAQPTPGPWFVSNGTFEQAHICGHEDVAIAVVSKQDPQCDGGRCTATERANAALIAAAPEMLAALQAVADEVRCYPESPRSYSGDSYLPEKFREAICAAIAAATGKAA